MKYAYGDKKDRREKWHTVPAPKLQNRKKAHIWCTQQDSDGKFYYHYTNTRWWFEFSEDATLFALTWGGR